MQKLLTNLSFSAVYMSPDKLDATVWETMFGSAKLVLLQYQMKLSTLLMHPGETQPNNSIGIITKSGCNIAVKKPINPFKANINNVLSTMRFENIYINA
jgi:hypothetical protein